MDSLEVESAPGQGTTVRLEKWLPQNAVPIGNGDLGELTARLALDHPAGSEDDSRQRNLELFQALEEVRLREQELERREADLRRANQELEETNRGVVALYSELDEKADALRRADELKSRFLSHVSHEFRTPLNSIMALAQLLIRRADGDLTPEQEKQVNYIRQAAQDLVELVNDLLDLAKVEAGKTEVHRTLFEAGRLFSALRGIMRPLAVNDAVALIFEDPPPGLELYTDESKLAQILRNLISNALKFTERGDVRVACKLSADQGRLLFVVSDTGIGIASDDQERIFQEFSQIRNPLQVRVRGTGLGLPLSRRLAILLQGSLEVVSTPGKGSTFTLTLPANLAGEARPASERDQEGQRDKPKVLVIDDEVASRYLTAQLFRGAPVHVIEASGGIEGNERARFDRPALILLDLMMPDRSGFDVLDDLKSDSATRDIPIVIQTSKRLNESDCRRLAGRHAGILPKGTSGRREALLAIRDLLGIPDLFEGDL